MANKHINISELHKATGISRQAISAIYHEKSNDPNSKTIIKLAEYLGCSLDELLARAPYVVEV